MPCTFDCFETLSLLTCATPPFLYIQLWEQRCWITPAVRSPRGFVTVTTWQKKDLLLLLKSRENLDLGQPACLQKRKSKSKIIALISMADSSFTLHYLKEIARQGQRQIQRNVRGKFCFRLLSGKKRDHVSFCRCRHGSRQNCEPQPTKLANSAKMEMTSKTPTRGFVFLY